MADVLITPEFHDGAVQARFHDGHVTVLCPLGHVVTARALDSSFGGSDLQARISWHQAAARSTDPTYRARHLWVVRCHGALPDWAVTVAQAAAQAAHAPLPSAVAS